MDHGIKDGGHPGPTSLIGTSFRNASSARDIVPHLPRNAAPTPNLVLVASSPDEARLPHLDKPYRTPIQPRQRNKDPCQPHKQNRHGAPLDSHPNRLTHPLQDPRDANIQHTAKYSCEKGKDACKARPEHVHVDKQPGMWEDNRRERRQRREARASE